MIDKDSNEWFKRLQDEEAIGLWHDYCVAVNYPEDYVYYNSLDQLKEINVSLSDIYHATRRSQYNLLDKFVAIDGYGHPMSTDKLDELMDVEELYEWNKANNDG